MRRTSPPTRSGFAVCNLQTAFLPREHAGSGYPPHRAVRSSAPPSVTLPARAHTLCRFSSSPPGPSARAPGWSSPGYVISGISLPQPDQVARGLRGLPPRPPQRGCAARPLALFTRIITVARALRRIGSKAGFGCQKNRGVFLTGLFPASSTSFRASNSRCTRLYALEARPFYRAAPSDPSTPQKRRSKRPRVFPPVAPWRVARDRSIQAFRMGKVRFD